jgi:hypothetical protein
MEITSPSLSGCNSRVNKSSRLSVNPFLSGTWPGAWPGSQYGEQMPKWTDHSKATDGELIGYDPVRRGAASSRRRGRRPLQRR